MGIVQFPAGVGNPIYIYDDTVNTNHPAAPGPHTAAEINAAFPVDFALMQDAAGNTFSANRRQYLMNVPVTNGGQTTDGAAFTSWVDTNIDLYSKVTGGIPNLRWRLDPGISPSSIVTIWGTKIGSGDKMGGKNGVGIYQTTGTFSFRGTVGLYAPYIQCQGTLQFLNSGATYQEIAGGTIEGQNAITLGTTDDPLRFYNTTISYRGTGNMLGGVNIADSANVVLLATGPNSFISSSAPNRKFRRVTLSGAVTSADFIIGIAAGFWEATRVVWSDTPGKPRIQMTGVHAVMQGLSDYEFFDTKVVDNNGLSIPNCPIYITTDVDGPILDTLTQPDGNVTFTWNPTGQSNVLPVREYYSTLTGTNTAAFQDRLFTMVVNGYSGSFPPLQSYETKLYEFKWPGIDRLGSGYQPSGGSFQPALDIISLNPGIPSKRPVWTDCVVLPA